MEKISWSLNIKVVDGPRIVDAKDIEVDAYDKIDVTIPADANASTDVNLQPGAAGSVKFLYIKADKYPTKQDKTPALTYTVDGGQEEFGLDGPQVFASGEQVKALGSGGIRTLEFTNSATGDNADVSVEILVGRSATT